MKLRRILTAGAVVAIAVGTAVVAAPSASAGEPIVWYQAVAVASASSPCPATTDAEKTAGWSEWTNSWAEWPHDGKGGNVCTRSITWAYEADPESPSSCIPVITWLFNSWAVFTDSYAPPTSSLYFDAACTQDPIPLGMDLVYAGSSDGAQALCDRFAPYSEAGSLGDPAFVNPNVWQCRHQV